MRRRRNRVVAERPRVFRESISWDWVVCTCALVVGDRVAPPRPDDIIVDDPDDVPSATAAEVMEKWRRIGEFVATRAGSAPLPTVEEM